MSDIELLRPLNHIGTNTIKTARLVLRRFQFSDHTDMFQWASDPDVVKYLSYAPHKTINETKAVLKSWIKNYSKTTTYNWAIEFQGVVIGNIAVVTQDDECFTCHLGWQIDKPYWNKGNIGSSKVMQKIGMTLEGTFRRYCYQKDGSIGDKFYYAILESDRH